MSEQMRDNLLVILGPTAVGKTSLSVQIAKEFSGEIISGDSMQVYQGLDIGTAKITDREKDGVPHYLIDCYSPDHPFSAAEFQELAEKKISEINKKNHLPIIVGGTGLYIKSITHKYQFPEAAGNEELRKELYLFAEQSGKEALHKRLADVDPIASKRLHVNDLKRVVRALEVYYSLGKTLSEILEEQQNSSSYNLLMLGLTMERSLLYERINQRVDIMIANGLVEEVQGLLDQGFDERYNSMQGIGYKEIIQYLRGEITLEQAIFLIKQGSRRFAKRQLSWFRQIPDINWFDFTNNANENRTENIKSIYHLIAGYFASLQK